MSLAPGTALAARPKSKLEDDRAKAEAELARLSQAIQGTNTTDRAELGRLFEKSYSAVPPAPTVLRTDQNLEDARAVNEWAGETFLDRLLETAPPSFSVQGRSLGADDILKLARQLNKIDRPQDPVAVMRYFRDQERRFRGLPPSAVLEQLKSKGVMTPQQVDEYRREVVFETLRRNIRQMVDELGIKPGEEARQELVKTAQLLDRAGLRDEVNFLKYRAVRWLADRSDLRASIEVIRFFLAKTSQKLEDPALSGAVSSYSKEIIEALAAKLNDPPYRAAVYDVLREGLVSYQPAVLRRTIAVFAQGTDEEVRSPLFRGAAEALAENLISKTTRQGFLSNYDATHSVLEGAALLIRIDPALARKVLSDLLERGDIARPAQSRTDRARFVEKLRELQAHAQNIPPQPESIPVSAPPASGSSLGLRMVKIDLYDPLGPDLGMQAEAISQKAISFREKGDRLFIYFPETKEQVDASLSANLKLALASNTSGYIDLVARGPHADEVIREMAFFMQFYELGTPVVSKGESLGRKEIVRKILEFAAERDRLLESVDLGSIPLLYRERAYRLKKEVNSKALMQQVLDYLTRAQFFVEELKRGARLDQSQHNFAESIFKLEALAWFDPMMEIEKADPEFIGLETVGGLQKIRIPLIFGPVFYEAPLSKSGELELYQAFIRILSENLEVSLTEERIPFSFFLSQLPLLVVALNDGNRKKAAKLLGSFFSGGISSSSVVSNHTLRTTQDSGKTVSQFVLSGLIHRKPLPVFLGPIGLSAHVLSYFRTGRDYTRMLQSLVVRRFSNYGILNVVPPPIPDLEETLRRIHRWAPSEQTIFRLIRDTAITVERFGVEKPLSPDGYLSWRTYDSFLDVLAGSRGASLGALDPASSELLKQIAPKPSVPADPWLGFSQRLAQVKKTLAQHEGRVRWQNFDGTSDSIFYDLVLLSHELETMRQANSQRTSEALLAFAEILASLRADSYGMSDIRALRQKTAELNNLLKEGLARGTVVKADLVKFVPPLLKILEALTLYRSDQSQDWFLSEAGPAVLALQTLADADPQAITPLLISALERLEAPSASNDFQAFVLLHIISRHPEAVLFDDHGKVLAAVNRVEGQWPYQNIASAEKALIRALPIALAGTVFEQAEIRGASLGAGYSPETLQLKSLLESDSYFNGTYEIKTVLGEGGFGVVFLGMHRRLNQPVAIKILKVSQTLYASLGPSPTELRQEMDALTALNHPNIVRVYDRHGIELKLPKGKGKEAQTAYYEYLVTEFVGGTSLEKEISKRKKEGKLTSDFALRMLGQLAGAEGAIAKAGLLHRDLKPQNVMLTLEGNAKLIDFGLAVSTDSAEPVTGPLIGTLQYMSPEQVFRSKDRGLDVRSDLYAIGVIGYQLLSGRLPYSSDLPNSGEALMEIQTKVAVEERLPLQKVDPALAGIIAKLLKKDPADRYQTPAELEQDLENYQEGKPLSFHQPIGETLSDTVEKSDWRSLAMAFTEMASAISQLKDSPERFRWGGKLGYNFKPANIYRDTTAKEEQLWIDQKHLASDEDSLRYLAPEQLRGDYGQVGERTDIYTLGAYLYELLTGFAPYEDSGQFSERIAPENLQKFKEWLSKKPRSPTPPHKINPNIPVGLSRIAMRALRWHPNDRYQNLMFVSDAFSRYLAGQWIPPLVIPGLKQGIRSILKRGLWAVSYSAIAGLIGYLVAVTYHYRANLLAGQFVDIEKSAIAQGLKTARSSFQKLPGDFWEQTLPFMTVKPEITAAVFLSNTDPLTEMDIKEFGNRLDQTVWAGRSDLFVALRYEAEQNLSKALLHYENFLGKLSPQASFFEVSAARQRVSQIKGQSLGTGTERRVAMLPAVQLQQFLEMDRYFRETYEIQGIAGESGFGVTFRGVHKRLGQEVAIKVLKINRAASAPAGTGLSAGLKTEADALTNLNHPNIIRVYDRHDIDLRIRTASGEIIPHRYEYLVTELAPGVTLDKEFIERKRRSALNADFALETLSQLVGAVGAISKAGLVHRDLKPQNILVTKEGEFKVVDFSRVVSVKQIRSDTGPIGNDPEYLPPEQIQPGGKRFADVRSDLYSIGVIGYQILAGRLPYESVSLQEGDSSKGLAEIRKKIFEEDRLPLSRVDPALAGIIAKLLKPDPAARYQSAAELEEDLEAYREGKPLSFHRPIHESLEKFIKRADWEGLVGAFMMISSMVHSLKDDPERFKWGGKLGYNFKPANIYQDTTQYEMKLWLDKKSQASDEESLPFLAPEQLSGEYGRVNERTDVYTLGAYLYELLTGYAPYEDPNQFGEQITPENFQKFKEWALKKPRSPTPPRQLDPKIPLALSRVVHQAIRPVANDRYQNPMHLNNALSNYLEGHWVPPLVVPELKQMMRNFLHYGLWFLTRSMIIGLIGYATSLVYQYRSSRLSLAFARVEQYASGDAAVDFRSFFQKVSSGFWDQRLPFVTLKPELVTADFLSSPETLTDSTVKEFERRLDQTSWRGRSPYFTALRYEIEQNLPKAREYYEAFLKALPADAPAVEFQKATRQIGVLKGKSLGDAFSLDIENAPRFLGMAAPVSPASAAREAMLRIYEPKPRASAEGKSLGRAEAPLGEPEILILDDLKKPTNVLIDYEDYHRNLSSAQLAELAKLAGRNAKNKKLQVIVYNAPEDALPEANIRLTVRGGEEALLAYGIKAAESIHYSRLKDPSSDLAAVLRDNQFRSLSSEEGLLGVALLYAQADDKEKAAQQLGLGKDPSNRFFAKASELILALVRQYESELVIAQAA